MTISGQTFINKFEQFCPLWLAEQGDPCGLHIGTLRKPVKKIMMTLDVRPEVVKEAVDNNIDLIIAKHPPIFHSIKRLTTDDIQVKMYADLMKNDIAVYAAHTNMDIMRDGLNDWFCEMLDIQVDDYLSKTHEIFYEKLVVYVPEKDAAEMRQALGDAGAGKLGHYHHSSYSMAGAGRFTPDEWADPTIGQKNQPEKVAESRIEVILPKTIEEKVLQAMFQVHPYEEAAYDLIPLANPPQTFGIGRIGHLKKPLDIESLVKKVKDAFDLDGLRLIQPICDPVKKIQKIAICGGSAGKYYQDALKKGADVYLTGDVYYHTAHDMQASGLTVIDPGHHIEVVCINKFIEKMEQWKKEEGWDVTFLASHVNTDPFQFR